MGHRVSTAVLHCLRQEAASPEVHTAGSLAPFILSAASAPLAVGGWSDGQTLNMRTVWPVFSGDSKQFRTGKCHNWSVLVSAMALGAPCAGARQPVVLGRMMEVRGRSVAARQQCGRSRCLPQPSSQRYKVSRGTSRGAGTRSRCTVRAAASSGAAADLPGAIAAAPPSIKDLRAISPTSAANRRDR